MTFCRCLAKIFYCCLAPKDSSVHANYPDKNDISIRHHCKVCKSLYSLKELSGIDHVCKKCINKSSVNNKQLEGYYLNANNENYIITELNGCDDPHIERSMEIDTKIKNNQKEVKLAHEIYENDPKIIKKMHLSLIDIKEDKQEYINEYKNNKSSSLKNDSMEKNAINCFNCSVLSDMDSKKSKNVEEDTDSDNVLAEMTEEIPQIKIPVMLGINKDEQYNKSISDSSPIDFIINDPILVNKQLLNTKQIDTIEKTFDEKNQSDALIIKSFTSFHVKCHVCLINLETVFGFLCDHNVCLDCLTIACIKRIWRFYQYERSNGYAHFNYECPVKGCLQVISVPTHMIIRSFQEMIKDIRFKEEYKEFMSMEIDEILESAYKLDGMI